MENRGRIVSWVARVICILAILFISLFSFDAIVPGNGFWQNTRDLLIHLVPSFILLLLLLLAWRYEMAGGALFVIIALVLSPYIYIHNYRMNNSVIRSMVVILAVTLPFVITGLLFITAAILKRRKKRDDE